MGSVCSAPPVVLTPSQALAYDSWMSAWYEAAGKCPETTAPSTTFTTVSAYLQGEMARAQELHRRRLWLMHEAYAKRLGDELTRLESNYFFTVMERAARNRQRQANVSVGQVQLFKFASMFGLNNRTALTAMTQFADAYGCLLSNWILQHFLPRPGPALGLDVSGHQSRSDGESNAYNGHLVLTMSWA
jgi:hypothetical protein